MSDVTAAIVFHGEQLLVPTAISSFTRCCDSAKERGIHVSRLALLDRPDDVTQQAVEDMKSAFDHVETVDYGDLGATRNAGVSLASSTYVAFFDGDDLWGDEWLVRAHQIAAREADPEVVYHPRLSLLFSADDYEHQSVTSLPFGGAKSHYFVHADSRSPGFDPRSLIFSNVWTANAFALRAIHIRFPYAPTDRDGGFGIEDWTWNMETLVNGVQHAIVPETVHCIRMKPGGSLGQQFVAQGVVPPIHEYAGRLEAMWDELISGS